LRETAAALPHPQPKDINLEESAKEKEPNSTPTTINRGGSEPERVLHFS